MRLSTSATLYVMGLVAQSVLAVPIEGSADLLALQSKRANALTQLPFGKTPVSRADMAELGRLALAVK